MNSEIITDPERIPIRVLIVDDEPEIGNFLGEFLISRKYEVYYAADGEEALKLIQRARPHVALVDYKMPGMNGLELLERMRETDPGVAAIMVTAHQDVEVGRKALERGAVDFLTKPIDLEYLEASLTIKISSMLE